MTAGTAAAEPSDAALSGFIAGVDYPMYVLTAADGPDGERTGCLVGFATQCSIGPPRFLACVSRANHTFHVVEHAPLVALHVLNADQHPLAALFGATTGDTRDKFAACRWHPGPGGVPLLDDCHRRLVATVLARFGLGDHIGLLLRPDAAHPGPAVPALMYSAVHDLTPGHPA